MTASGTWSASSAPGVPGRGLYLNEKALAKPMSATSRIVSANSALGLAREADDEVGREGDVGARRAHAIDQAAVFVACVPAVHRREHAVRARLHRADADRA